VHAVAVVLAAGGSARMGRPKQLLPWRGRPLVAHVLSAVADAGLEEAVVVLGHSAGEVTLALDPPPGVHVRLVVNPDHASGQASSLRAGLAAAGPGADGALVLLADQPEVRADAIRAVVGAGTRAGVARAGYGGRPGHPVLLGRDLWPRVAGLRGDVGARDLIAADPGRLREVETGGAPPPDVDTPDAYARLLERE
jgi:molybdenum cofactor cytidylyltransferase